MKLKYKKMVLVVTTCVMGIGMVTFTIKNQADKTSTEVEQSADIQTFSAELSTDATSDVTAEVELTITPVPTQEVVAASAAAPLEKNSNKEINELITKYLNAKLAGTVDEFETLVNDKTLIDIDDLNRKTKYIEKYDNLTCYTKEGPEENTYLVYAYHEVKFKSIETLAPAMNEFYVKANEDGSLYIYLGAIDQETEKYFEEIRESDDVMDLIYTVNNKLDKILEKDTDLASFYGKLIESAQNVSSNE
ncbi:MAG: hypothetical protein ACK5JH_07975 [Anaerocolumna sp.]